MRLSRAAVLAALAACAAAPSPVPLHNLADEHGDGRELIGAQCPPSAPPRVKPSSPSVGAIEGTVIDEQCGLVPGATVLVLGNGRTGSRVDMTDEHGRFAFDDLLPDQYVISVYYLDSKLERGGVRIRAGTVEHVRLAMPPPVKAQPRITHDPPPPP